MSKKILFFSLFILIFLISSKQNPNAKTWKRHHSKIPSDSIMAAIEQGDSVIIFHCQIMGPLRKEGTAEKPDTIKSVIKITESFFSSDVSFEYCYFMEEVRFFSDTIFIARFSNTTFSKYASFLFTRFFHSNFIVFFDSSTFCEDVSFRGVSFSALTDFSKTTFRKLADFSKVTFGGPSTFENAFFKGKVSFYSTTFGRDADFSGAIFGGNVYINPVEFKNIYISWKQLKGHLFYYPPANLKLIKYFEEQRQLDDADGVYLFLKDQERMKRSPWVRYPEYWFIQLTCGYGVKPLRTLIVCGLVIILFSALYTKSNAIKEIEKELGHRRRRRKYRIVHKGFGKRFYDALYFSVHTFIIGVVSDWHPTDEFLIETKRVRLFKFRTLSMIEGALGWILLVLFVVTLTRKFIR